MPTGYTSAIGDNPDLTFEQFAWRCARALVSLAPMRDQSLDVPVPERFEPEAFYAKRVTEAEARVARLVKMLPAEAEAAAEEDYKTNLASMQQIRQREKDLLFRYENMLMRVRSWQPPTKDHESLRILMVEQIRTSIDIDCGHEWPDPERKTGAVWLAEQMIEAQEEWLRAVKAEQEEVERTKKRNDWIADLRYSLTGGAK